MSIKRSKRSPRVSLIIPVYNETVRLVSGLATAVSYLQKQRYSWEIIVIDDGSRIPVTHVLDEAVKKKELRRAFVAPVRVIRLEKNLGKGAAVGRGVAEAKGDVIIFSDVDFSVPIHELRVMLNELTRYQMVIASRRLAKSSIVIHQAPLRESAGRIFTVLSNIICDTRAFDVTCGFKGFTRESARKIFSLRRINRWVFDTEIVFLARKHGISLGEMPVAWSHKAGSKVKAFDGVQSFVDLLRIKWYEIKGLYT
jgi:dolichyl-phosphate beta-glucosyltransferase